MALLTEEELLGMELNTANVAEFIMMEIGFYALQPLEIDNV